MKYDLIEIRPTSKNEWESSFSRDDTDRERGPSKPNALGFYHYPRYISHERAFDKLKSLLCKKHKREIRRLQKSLLKLEALSCPNTSICLPRQNKKY